LSLIFVFVRRAGLGSLTPTKKNDARALSPPPSPLPPQKNIQEEVLSSRDEKDPSKPKSYIFVEFPHGAIPLSELISGTVCQVRFLSLAVALFSLSFPPPRKTPRATTKKQNHEILRTT